MRVRELVERRDAAMRVFEMSDGGLEAELFTQPRHFRDHDGDWQPIDVTVREDSADGYVLGNDTNAFASAFGDRTDRLTRFAMAGTSVELGLQTSSRRITPLADGNTVTYQDAFPGADLRYQVTPDSLKEEILLAAPPKDPTYRFSLRLDGVTAEPQPDGSIAFFGDDGPPLYTMPAPFMVDSSADRRRARSDRVAQTVEQHGDTITVTVRADRTWLSAPERAYPVVIDPTIIIDPTATGGQDAQVWSDTPTTNFGARYELSVGTDPFGVAMSLLKFDLSVVPAGSSLTSASLRMYYDNELHNGATNVTMETRRITAAWAENSVTWSSFNRAYAAAQGSTVKQANVTNTWSEWDVRAIAQSWVSGSAPNHGLAVRSTNETLENGGAVYQAAEFDYNGDTEVFPKLILTFGRPGAGLQPITKTYATGAELVWTPYANPDPADPNDDIVEYQVHRSVSQVFTPSASTLVTAVGGGATRFVDTTATPTPSGRPDLEWNAFHYLVAVKTRSGELIPSVTRMTRTPMAGQVRQIFSAAADTTLSANQPTTNLNALTGQRWLMVGNNSTTFGRTRAVMAFNGLSAVPAGTTVVDADLSIWGFYANPPDGSAAILDGHPLTRGFVENQATWSRASTATAWTAAGGDLAARADFVSDVTSRPTWHIWENASMVQGWVNNPATNLGFAVKLRDETVASQRVLFNSDEATEVLLRPRLAVSYNGAPPTPPAAPIVSSADYPADGQPHGAPGQAGAFTFRPGNGFAISKYVYQLDSDPSPTEVAGTGQVTVNLTPAASGTRRLTVRTLTANGVSSPATTYTFVVAEPSHYRNTKTDVNGDGRDDAIAFARGEDGSVRVALSDGTGFADPSVLGHEDFATDTTIPLTGDVNGDGRADLVSFTRGTEADVLVALSTGTGFATEVLTWHDNLAAGTAIPLLGDFDGDGRDDVASATRGDDGAVHVALSTGDGFAAATEWRAGFALGTAMPAVGDVNGDQKDDLVAFTGGEAADVLVALSSGSGFAATSTWHDNFAPDANRAGVGDTDGDGRADVVSFGNGQVSVATSTGAGFGAARQWHASFAPDALPGLGDFTGDGKFDVVAFTRGDSATATVAVSDGATFGAATEWHGDLAPGERVPRPSLFAAGPGTPAPTPPARPTVSSSDYPADGQPHGGPGMPGSFVLAPGDDVPIGRFTYQLDTELPVTVPATGETTVTIAPASAGERTLTVRTFTPGGLASEPATHTFLVAEPPRPPAAPQVSSSDYPADGQPHGQPGQAGSFTFAPDDDAPVTGYRWQLDDGTPADVAGTGEVQIYATPATPGQHTLTVRALGTDNLVSVPATYRFVVADAPGSPGAPLVTSLDYPSGGAPHGAPGQEGTFTFRPTGSNAIAGYRWQLNGGPSTDVPATGKTTVRITPTTSGTQTLSLRTFTSAGLVSAVTTYVFEVAEATPPDAPTVSSVDYPADGQPHGGAGQAGMFTLRPNGTTPVSGYRWRLNNGQATDVPGTGETQVSITPPTGGTHTVVVWAIGSTGAASPPVTYTFLVGGPAPTPDAPLVSSTDYPADGKLHGSVGEGGEFTLRTQGPVAADAFRYQLDTDAAPTEVPAGTGTATITLTPVRSGQLTLTVWAKATASGVLSAPVKYVFVVGAPAGPRDYFYDAAGQLVGVVNNAGEAAAYRYDAAGNLTRTDRYNAATASVFALVPARGPVGSTVEISGTGFDITAGNNQVTFDGIAAQVTAASANRLTVVVPADAGAGHVEVTANGRSATSPTPFSVTAATSAPTIAGLSADRANPGDRIVISGTGFDPDPIRNVVLVHQTTARVLQAGPRGLTVEVPAAANSGKITVRTPGGQTSSATDVLIAPRGFRIDDLVYGGRIQLGTPSEVAISAGKAALVLVDGEVGERLHLDLENNTIPVRSAMWMFTPHGGDFARRTMGDPLDLFAGSTLRQDIPVFGHNGTYTIVVAPDDDAAGSVRITASHDLTGDRLTRDGTGVPFTIDQSEETAELPFTATEGEWLSLGLTDLSMPQQVYNVAVVRPDGGRHIWRASLTEYVPTMVFQAEETGTHKVTVTFGPGELGFGKVWLSSALEADQLLVDGPSVPFQINRPGQSVRLPFTGVANQNLRFSSTENTLRENGRPGYPTGILVEPDGNQVELRTGTQETRQVPVRMSGEHNLFMTGWEAVGRARAWLSTAVEAGPLPVNALTQVTVDRPGREVWYDYDGVTGEPLRILSPTKSLPGTFRLRLYRPSDGRQVASTLDGRFDVPALPETGRYRLYVEPIFATTGTVTLAVSKPVDAGVIALDGPVVTQAVPIPGQTLVARFTGQAGQRLSLGYTSPDIPFARARVTKPDGTTLDTTAAFGLPYGFDLTTLPVDGEYRIQLEPITQDGLPATGELSLVFSGEVDGGLAEIGGSARTMTIDRLAQNGKVTFAGTAGDRLRLTVTRGLPDNRGAYYKLIAPSGVVEVSRRFMFSDQFNLPAPLAATGTYTLVFDPDGNLTGTIAVAISRQPTAAAATTGQRLEPGPAPATAVCPRSEPDPPTAKFAPAPSGSDQPEADEPPADIAAATPCEETDGWAPDKLNLNGRDWTTRYDPAPVRDRPLEFAVGYTGVVGEVRSTSGKPLADVPVSVGDRRVTTDAKGKFALTGIPDGRVVLRVDGRTNATGRTFAAFDIGVDVEAGRMLVLPHTVFLPEIDPKSVVRVPSPTTEETVLTTDAIPGLEVHLPKGTVVRDADGEVATELSLTPIPIDRAPFPLPPTKVPVYFTVQPGGGYLFPEGATIIYPNYTKEPPGTRTQFWNYDPDRQGWHIYGYGTVSRDGKQIVPDKDVKFYRLTGAMTAVPGMNPAARAPRPNGTRVGDPVDPATGLLVDEATDLVIDDIMPIEITRTYQQGDTDIRAFGVGTSFNYGHFPWSPGQIGNFDFQQFDLVQPDGSKVHYTRTSPGRDFAGAVFAADPTPTEFDRSVVRWVDSGWELTLRDGTVMTIGEEAPIQEIRDKFGNATTITRATAPPGFDGKVRANGPITQITSPSGKWVRFTYDEANPPKVTAIEDNIGRRVSYTYDATGHLTTVTDVRGGVTRYGWDAEGRLETITDPRDTRYLLNEYDDKGRVLRQTAADGGITAFEYIESGEAIVETRMTDPRGHVRRFTFNPSGSVLTDTKAYGTSLAQTTTYEYEAGGVRRKATVDPLNRRTTYLYDTHGFVREMTLLAGTAEARTEKWEYNGPHNELTRHTDSYGKQTVYDLDDRGAVESVTDPANRVTNYETDDRGLVTRVTDPVGKSTSVTYAGADAITTTDPLGGVSRAAYDALGRPVVETDPRRATTATEWTAAGDIAAVTDPLGRTIAYEYNANGYRTKVTDPRGGQTRFDYDEMDRPERVTDPLGADETIEYDLNGNLVMHTSRRGVVTEHDQDELDRREESRFGTESTVTYSYDDAGRVTGIDDSVAGTLTRTYDGLDRVRSETTPHGAVSYTYGTTVRDRTMTVSGQPVTRHVYDASGLLARVERGGAVVTEVARNARGLPERVGAPGDTGVSQTYAYDDAGQVTSLTYQDGTSGLGQLSYTYDAAGLPVRTDGEHSRTVLPEPFGSATYDAANRVRTVGATRIDHDADGNLTDDGTASYGWNAKGQLKSLSGQGIEARFTYGPDGNRWARTVAGATTSYLYDGVNPLRETDGGRAVTLTTTGEVDGFQLRHTADGDYRMLTDVLGSTTGVIGEDTGSVGTYAYEPFGRTYVAGDVAGNPYRFTGREDDGTGLYFYRARYYSPTLHRFVSEDPLGFAGGANLYSYVDNLPTALVDPLGLKPSNTGNYANQTLGPGPYAKEGVGLVNGNINAPGVRDLINDAGNKYGCHTCGAASSGNKSGNWIPDHQPPTALVPPGTPQTAYPHCSGCARSQGGMVRQLAR
ncbi:DNRLRE domain-containing protein [Actinophytocola glycyrrhizae]|uniref:DNRLRE domain-containing protein n=1 Tax=Actinophytocola glycyrrhizae TaxID=2044873 RepID=A0ABV9S2U6_9PSEU